MKILAFGSNLPFNNNSPKQNIENAYELLYQNGIKILNKSSFYKSEAYPNKSDPEFCNSAISIETDFEPDVLLKIISKIEESFERKRYIKNSPRTLDIDIISFNNLILDEENLTIPHPEIHNRLFVLLPIEEINKTWEHPVLLKSVTNIIKEYDQTALNKVKKIQ